MAATIPPAARALLALLLPMAALFVLEGRSACVMLEEAAELHRGLYLALASQACSGRTKVSSVQMMPMTMQQKTQQIIRRKLQIRQRSQY